MESQSWVQSQRHSTPVESEGAADEAVLNIMHKTIYIGCIKWADTVTYHVALCMKFRIEILVTILLFFLLRVK
jgi:hypothetical protein